MHSPQPSSTPRCAQAAHGCACAAVSWAGLAVSWSGPPAVSQPQLPCHSAPRACHAQRPRALTPLLPSANAPACALRATRASPEPPARPACSPCRWCNGCIAIQPCPCPLLPGHNTPECIATQIVPSQVSCNTILQYNPSLAASVMVQLPSLQYNWAVAQIILCTKFVFFSLYIFFYLFHNTQINL